MKGYFIWGRALFRGFSSDAYPMRAARSTPALTGRLFIGWTEIDGNLALLW